MEMSNLVQRVQRMHHDSMVTSQSSKKLLIATPAEAASSSSPARGVADSEPVPVPDAPADSEEEDEEPAAREARLIREAASVEHRLAHFHKNPARKVCTQARMYARKTARVRHDPSHDHQPPRSVKDLQRT